MVCRSWTLKTGVDEVIVRKKSRDVKDRIQMVVGEYVDEAIGRNWRRDEMLATRCVDWFAYFTAVSDSYQRQCLAQLSQILSNKVI